MKCNLGVLLTFINIVNFMLIISCVCQISDILLYTLEQYGIDSSTSLTFIIRVTVFYLIGAAVCYLRRICEKFIHWMGWFKSIDMVSGDIDMRTYTLAQVLATQNTLVLEG